MRLGDLDELKKAILEHKDDYIEDNFFWTKLFDIIDNAPTVEITKPQSYCMGFTDGLAAQNYEKPPMFERPQGEREFLDRVNISELSNEEKLKLVEQIMPDNKYDEVILAHERIAYERGVADGYAEAIEEGTNTKPKCEDCEYRKFAEKFIEGIVAIMNEQGIKGVDELMEKLKGGAE